MNKFDINNFDDPEVWDLICSGKTKGVFQLESNLAFECQHIIHSMQERGVQKWVALSEGQGGSIGWLTTNERKEAMVFQLRDALRVGNIFLSDEFFSVLMEEREAIKTIRDELCRFAIITEPAKTLFGKVCLTVFLFAPTYTPTC